MGFKVFRMSINWTRIFPTGMEEKPNEAGLEFYDKVFVELNRYGIEPLVTISHYEMPYALIEECNGWASRKCVQYYMNYCKAIFERYKDKVKYWLTFNEINAGTARLGSVLSLGTIKGYEGPITEVPEDKQTNYQALHHQFIASALAVKYAHDNYPQFKMGNMCVFATMYPMTCNPDDVIKCQKEMQNMNWFTSDVQVRGAYPYYSKRFLKKIILLSIKNRAMMRFLRMAKLISIHSAIICQPVLLLLMMLIQQVAIWSVVLKIHTLSQVTGVGRLIQRDFVTV